MSDNLYNLTDEELMSINPETLNSEQEEKPDEVEPETKEESQVENEQTPEAEAEPEQETEQPAPVAEEEFGEPVNEGTQTQTDEAPEDTTDYKAFYAAITQPFKANGKTVQITDPSDVIRLVQQGMNYSQKMATIKGSMAIIKTLEQNGLASADKLSYLIDLHNKKPEAIAKLVKDSELDVYSLDTDKADDYVPVNQLAEYSELEAVLEELGQNSAVFSAVVSTVADKWDEKSKSIIGENPDIMRVLNQHAEIGLFDKVMAKVETAQMLGKIPSNTPLISVYYQYEQELLAEAKQAEQPKTFTAPRPTQAKPASNVNNNKNKAALPGAGSTSNNNNNIDPLAMSDEEVLQYMSTLT